MSQKLLLTLLHAAQVDCKFSKIATYCRWPRSYGRHCISLIVLILATQVR